MPLPVPLGITGARAKRFRKREPCRAVVSRVPGKHDRGARKKIRVTELSPEPGVRREMRAEIDKGLLRVPVRRHPLETDIPMVECHLRGHQQSYERIAVFQAMQDAIGLRSPAQHTHGIQAAEFLLQRGKRKTRATGEFAHVNARIRSGPERLKQAAAGGTGEFVKGIGGRIHG